MKQWMTKAAMLTAGLAVACAFALPAQAREWKTFESKKYGYSLKIPAEFTISDEDKTTNWIYQPGSAATGDSSKSKKKSFGVNIRGIGFKTEESESSSSSGDSGGLQPALGIYVNWTWMPDVDSGTMYSTNKKSDQQNIDSPDPDYKDIVDFDKKKGYDYEGNTYWYKEVDKSQGDEIHRWHIKSYGNKSAYIVGLTGTYEQFKEWGPVYEEVIKSWKLIPLEK
ncbi:MAG: hypothetical protein GC168_20290 [Candidatus Hydrogenedens sp.]|nr:hypothetical protein [Candidatus Hydrogenedens sp.]